MKKPRQKKVLFIRDLPPDLKDQFKAWCARRGISMTTQITTMLQKLVQSDLAAEPPKTQIVKPRKRNYY